ncbi:hypothetical protein OS493_027066 [Desmophyllum pertusum]|uniref:TNFR-Cys domain-containing protein n=1 Tax=Desmophyllum pertusum TaxID=174260 RepID=A0A9W9Y9H5_9CNID|nr:hypothetical protein OS493_027066 [Desmophyllum pertusum]
MPFYKQCNANEISCQPKCLDDQYLVVTRKGANICENCKTCPIGSSLSPQCGSILESTDDIKCLECTEGKTFSDKPGKEPCKVCSMCSVGQKELIPCNLTHDRVCGQCDKGFYNVTSIECKPCSACCDDDYDVRVASCVAQNMPENKQCGYTQQAMCQQKNGKTIIHSKFPSIINVVAIGIGIITAIAVLVLCCYLTYRRCKGQPEEPQSHMDSITLENQTTHSSQDTLSFDKSDSKLLCSLLQHESDDVRKIYDRLDTKMPGHGHYRAVALYHGLDHYQIASGLDKNNDGPSRALIEWLAAEKPELTVKEFVTVVRRETKRNDVANLLEAYDANYTN